MKKEPNEKLEEGTSHSHLQRAADMKKEPNEKLEEGTSHSHLQRLPRLQDSRSNMKVKLANKGLGYREALMSTDGCFSCTTFNILAPIYKRLNKEDQNCRESQYRTYWLIRNQNIIDRLMEERSSIICLQEVWLGNDELVEMYEKRLGDAGYMCFKLARTNNRGDGLLTAIRRDCFKVLNYRKMLFNDLGDRVAQLLHVEYAVPFWQSRNCDITQEIIIVNTHLLFPHDYTLCIVRLHQVFKILQYVESYQKEHMLNPLPVILCGDWNGTKRGHVYKFLRSQGFASSYDVAHQYTDSEADAHKWVSHRNHWGNICGVDFIWLLNPNKHQKPLKTSWNETVFGILKFLLSRQASLTEGNAFAFLKADSPGDYITFHAFCQALCQLSLTGSQNGLSSEEMEDLWIQADVDGDGVVNYGEFVKQIWKNPSSKQGDAEERESNHDIQNFGFDVKNAALFPPEVEKGLWPESYSLSDHAPLTVVFSPHNSTWSSEASPHGEKITCLKECIPESTNLMDTCQCMQIH